MARPDQPEQPATNLPTDAVQVAVDGGSVRLQIAGAAPLVLSPEAAAGLAERLLAAAAEAGAAGSEARRNESAPERPRPPFPPANLVSPHAAG